VAGDEGNGLGLLLVRRPGMKPQLQLRFVKKRLSKKT
jgi:hypothetical protein